MKRILSLICVAVMMLAVSGCSKNKYESIDVSKVKSIELTEVMPVVDYADDSIVIWHTEYGLFINSSVDAKLLYTLDTVEIGMNHMEGSAVTKVLVSEDLSSVFLFNEGSDADGINTDIIYRYKYKEDLVESVQKIDVKTVESKSRELNNTRSNSNAVVHGNYTYYVSNNDGEFVYSLMLVKINNDTSKMVQYPLFV